MGVQGQPALHTEFRADLVSNKEVGGAVEVVRSPRKTGSARANVLGSQKPRAQNREEPAGSTEMRESWWGGGRRREEWSQAPRLGLLSGRSLGTLGHRRGGCQPALPPAPPPRWQPAKPEARAGAMPGGGVPGPPRPAAANPDGAHVLVMAGLASRQQPRGRGGWSASVRVREGVGVARGGLHAAPVGAGIAGGGLGAPSPPGGVA